MALEKALEGAQAAPKMAAQTEEMKTCGRREKRPTKQEVRRVTAGEDEGMTGAQEEDEETNVDDETKKERKETSVKETQTESDNSKEMTGEPGPSAPQGPSKKWTILAAAAGATGAVVLAPVALGAAGFTSAGIAAGSIAAQMMSAAAVANGGGVAAGSLVAVLQSAGAVGLSGAATAAVASVGGALGGAVGWLTSLKLTTKKKD